MFLAGCEEDGSTNCGRAAKGDEGDDKRSIIILLNAIHVPHCTTVLMFNNCTELKDNGAEFDVGAIFVRFGNFRTGMSPKGRFVDKAMFAI